MPPGGASPVSVGAVMRLVVDVASTLLGMTTSLVVLLPQASDQGDWGATVDGRVRGGEAREQVARRVGVPLTVEHRPGEHTWEFWDAGVARVIDWIAQVRAADRTSLAGVAADLEGAPVPDGEPA